MNRLRCCPLALLLACACGGRTALDGPVDHTTPAADTSGIAVPAGYRTDLIAEGFLAPAGITFDEQGTAYVIESGSREGDTSVAPRLIRIEPNGARRTLYVGESPPWSGVAWGAGKLYIAEGGSRARGRILEVDAFTAAVRDVVVDLPSAGDHGTNGLLYSSDGYLYWGQGSATNAGVAGRGTDFHDTPCEDVVLVGHNFQTDGTLTGAFQPFGTPSTPGQVIRGAVPCTGAILRVRVSEVPRASAPVYSPIEVYAWGFRNPNGVAFGPDGALYATENGFEQGGSRDIFGAGDMLWKLDQGRWYGWPDYSGGRPVNTRRFQAPGKAPAAMVLKDRGAGVPRPQALFPVRANASGLDFSRSEAFGAAGNAFVVVGPKLVRVDVQNGVSEDFASGFGRASALRFTPDGRQLYVADLEGRVWSIRRDGPPLVVPVALSEQQTRGQAVFFKNCNECHPGGEAGLGPQLHHRDQSDAMIREQVRVPLGEMPPFGKDVISDAELDALIAYLRRAQLLPNLEPPATPVPTPDDGPAPGG